MKGPGMPPIAALLMVAAGAIVAACGGSAGGSGPSQTTSAGVQTSSSTSLSTSQAASTAESPSPDPASQAVIRAYEAANRAFVHAISIPDPNDPALVATMTGEQLSTVKKNLIIDKASGIVARGDVVTMHPHVVSISGTVGIVRDCTLSTLAAVYAVSGLPAPGAGRVPENDGITATLTLVDGVWKESLRDGKLGSCPDGY